MAQHDLCSGHAISLPSQFHSALQDCQSVGVCLRVFATGQQRAVEMTDHMGRSDSIVVISQRENMQQTVQRPATSLM